MKEGLKNSLNAIREISSEIYHQYVPIIDDNTDIGAFGTPILNNPIVMNEFVSGLVNRIAYSKFENKYFKNPLQVLEGETIPLGYSGQDGYINPAKGRQYNGEDFAGLLAKYEIDAKVQYSQINMDLQYPVTINRQTLKKAFLSWEALEEFIGTIANSLYNGAFIDEFQFTKELVAAAYKSNQVIYEVVSAVNSEANAKAFTKKARKLYLDFQNPSKAHNAWSKVGGAGKAVTIWSERDDIYLIIRNDVMAELDVDVMANAFNIDKAELLGKIITVDNFNVYDEDGNVAYDGSNILGIMADKSWFKIRKQDMFLDEFYNPNNRTWQYFLNLIKMYNYSLFSNAVVFATQAPSVEPTALKVSKSTITVKEGETATVNVETTPFSANGTITVSSSAEAKATATISNKVVTITGVDDGSATITLSANSGEATATIAVTVEAGGGDA